MELLENNVIEVRDLSAGYGRQVVLEHVSFQVRRGEVLAVLGGSGCGKTTLLTHLIGLRTPLAGSIWLEGKNFSGADERQRLSLLRRIGVSYQSGALFGSMNLLENVKLAMEEFTSLPKAAVELIALMKLDLVGLRPFAWHLPSEISGGMQKRAAIARAMAMDPVILFLDEPSAGLDPVTSAELDALIRRLADTLSITVVMVTHELASILSVADRCIFLDRGVRGILATGDPRELRDHSTEPAVHAFFNRLPPSGNL